MSVHRGYKLSHLHRLPAIFPIIRMNTRKQSSDSVRAAGSVVTGCTCRELHTARSLLISQHPARRHMLQCIRRSGTVNTPRLRREDRFARAAFVSCFSHANNCNSPHSSGTSTNKAENHDLDNSISCRLLRSYLTSDTSGTRTSTARSARNVSRSPNNHWSGTARLRGHRPETNAGSNRARHRSGGDRAATSRRP